jgi:hypothetical protein
MLGAALAASLLGLADGGLVVLFWSGLAAVIGAGSFVGARTTRALGVAVTLAALTASLLIYHAKFGSAALSEAGLPVSGALFALCLAAFALLVFGGRRSRQSAQDAPDGIALPAE